ncbi:MAG: Npt1/Npt2 family nucleotide transporter [Oligoflexales bacterium]
MTKHSELNPMGLRIWNKLKAIFFPVEKSEFGFFLPVFFLYFCLAFIYNGLRPLKITLVTSVSTAGAEIIPFLKVWGIVPGAFLFTYLFTRLSRVLSRENIFYTMISIFISYYVLFATVLYPYGYVFTLDKVAEFLRSVLPTGMRGLISMIQYWYVSIFYVMCEVWSSVIMFMLYWGYVNEVTPMTKAARFYPLYNLGGNLASTFSGWLLFTMSKKDFSIFLGEEKDSIANYALVVIGIATFMAIIATFLFRYSNKKMSEYPVYNLEFDPKPKKRKPEKVVFTLTESINQVLNSKYLLYLLVLVVAYNLVFNLTDILWSQEVKNYFGSDQIKMAGFIGKVTMYKGILSTFLVFLAHIIIRKFGWKRATLITPVIILGTSLLFFPLISLQGNELFKTFVFDMFSSSLTWISVVLGGVQNAMARGTKYSIYDSTKEMAFIPLSIMEKRKGKAVIDGIASRIGKSSGSVIIMALLLIFSNLQESIPYIALISISVTVFWVMSIIGLDELMKEKNNQVNEKA